MGHRQLLLDVRSSLHQIIENDVQNFRFQREETIETQRKLRYLNLHMRDAELKGDDKHIMYLHGNMALAYIKLDDPDKARVHLLEQLRMAEEMKDNTSKRMAHGNLGVLAKRSYNLHEAHHHFQESLQIAKHHNNLHAQARLYGNLASISEMTSQYRQAIEFQKMRLEVSEKLDDVDGMCKAQAALGALFHVEDDLPNSIRFYESLNDNLRKKLKVMDVLADDVLTDGNAVIDIEVEDDSEHEDEHAQPTNVGSKQKFRRIFLPLLRLLKIESGNASDNRTK